MALTIFPEDWKKPWQSTPYGTGTACANEQHDGRQRNLEDVGFKR